MTEFKSLLLQGRLTVLSHRHKYVDAVTKYKLDVDDIVAALMALTTEDWFAGPEPDVGFPGTVWKFAPDMETDAGTVQMYIKIKIRLDPKEALCISFHEAEQPISRFPYRARTPQ